MIPRLLLIWISLASIVLAEPKFIDSQISDSGRLKISRFRNEETGDYSVILDSQAQKGFLLYAYNRMVNVKFSPDEKFIVIDDRFASDASDAFLFEKGKDGRFKQIKPDGLREGVMKLIIAQYKLSDKFPFHHFYLISGGWDNKHTLRLRGWGYGEAGVIDDWFCSYDIVSDKFMVLPETLKEVRFERKKN